MIRHPNFLQSHLQPQPTVQLQYEAFNPAQQPNKLPNYDLKTLKMIFPQNACFEYTDELQMLHQI